VSASLVAFAGAHAAPTPETLAEKTFAARQKTALSAYRSALKAAEQQLGIELKAVESGLKTGLNFFEAGNATFTALRDFQAAAQTAATSGIQEQADAANDALSAIGGALEGHFPETFYLSDGEPAAAFQESLTSDLAKAHSRIRKRVGRIRALFEKGGFGLSFRVRAPRPLEQLAWQDNFVLGVGEYAPYVDLIVAWSNSVFDDDGQVRVAGAASEGPVDVFIDNGTAPSSANDLVVFEERFTTSFLEAGFPEGSWIVQTEASELAIGIR
jgi:hypothetical protein